jgi:hypothetical protein
LPNSFPFLLYFFGGFGRDLFVLVVSRETPDSDCNFSLSNEVLSDEERILEGKEASVFKQLVDGIKIEDLMFFLVVEFYL